MREVTGGLAVAMQRIQRLQRHRHNLYMAGDGDGAESRQITTELRKFEPLRRQYIKDRFFAL